ncbi:MAG TPA: hypothetical protein VFV27_02180 [Nevskiaceae bacterium]|nr:hypothetical protein [Nevskiaceae bacterium]
MAPSTRKPPVQPGLIQYRVTVDRVSGSIVGVDHIDPARGVFTDITEDFKRYNTEPEPAATRSVKTRPENAARWAAAFGKIHWPVLPSPDVGPIGPVQPKNDPRLVLTPKPGLKDKLGPKVNPALPSTVKAMPKTPGGKGASGKR